MLFLYTLRIWRYSLPDQSKFASYTQAMWLQGCYMVVLTNKIITTLYNLAFRMGRFIQQVASCFIHAMAHKQLILTFTVKRILLSYRFVDGNSLSIIFRCCNLKDVHTCLEALSKFGKSMIMTFSTRKNRRRILKQQKQNIVKVSVYQLHIIIIYFTYPIYLLIIRIVIQCLSVANIKNKKNPCQMLTHSVKDHG